MAQKGHIQNGGVVLDEPLDLPDGTVVELLPVSLPPGRHHPDVERFAGVISNASEDDKGDHLKYLEKKHQ
jgi:hypothetical protein